MFALTDGMHYYLCQHYVDMRKGMTGLYRLVKSDMSLSPVSGDVFVFFSRKRDMVKILRWDTDGFILYQKRLEEGTFEVPRSNPDTGSYELSWNFSFDNAGRLAPVCQMQETVPIEVTF